ncbi:MAG TPA: hypothetical protein VGS41_08905, partial [Chthonomonadales bacterium]|nr:hypothetical protein [Chthonomonadales bacterium]
SAYPAPYPTIMVPGSRAELSVLLKNGGTAVAQGRRVAPAGTYWVYGLRVVPGAECRLELEVSAPQGPQPPEITVVGHNGKPLAVAVSIEQSGAVIAAWTVPDDWPTTAPMRAIIGAKQSELTVQQVLYTVVEPDRGGFGIPDFIRKLMLAGAPKGARVIVNRPDPQPQLIGRVDTAPDSQTDWAPDAVISHRPDATTIAAWKQRGTQVWADAAANSPASSDPTALQDLNYGLAAGCSGVCVDIPPRDSTLKADPDLASAWQRSFPGTVPDPASSVDSRWRAEQLAAALQTGRYSAALDDAETHDPMARRIAALQDSITCSERGQLSPYNSIAALPEVQDVLGTLEAPAASASERHPDGRFAEQYLKCAAMDLAARAAGKRLLLRIAPPEGQPVSAEISAPRLRDTLVAAMLAAQPDGWCADSRFLAQVNGGDAAQTANLADQCLLGFSSQPSVSDSGTVGILISDSLQWQRNAPTPDDLSGLYGMALPLLQRGVAVEAVPLGLASDAALLKRFKTLLLSYDYQKPLSNRVGAGLAAWVRSGGTLLFFGGSDPYNSAGGWWRAINLDAPQRDLWNRLGLSDLGSARAVHAEEGSGADLKPLKPVADAVGPGTPGLQCHVDVTNLTSQNGKLLIRLSAAAGAPGSPQIASISLIQLTIGGKVAAAFQPGSETETYFLASGDGSIVSEDRRDLSGAGFCEYRFDRLPTDAPIILTVRYTGPLAICGGSPSAEQPALIAAVPANPVTQLFPELRLPGSCTATIYSGAAAGAAPAQEVSALLPPTSAVNALYSLNEGGIPVWIKNVDHGLVVNAGISPDYLAGSDLAAAWLRALTQYGAQRAGAIYREPGRFRLDRGPYTVVRTLWKAEPVEGKTIDLFSPDLGVETDRTIPPHTSAFLYRVPAAAATPQDLVVSDRVDARLEMETLTSLLIRGPLGSSGIARIDAAGRSLVSATAEDRFGRPVQVEVVDQGDLPLLRFRNDPDGIILRVLWH